ncbi:hypothetical protein JCM16303_001504 [Sporobolomyces ruberrimus]
MSAVSSQHPPPAPAPQERLLGTLIVIVLRAKNLPNRVRIGKQNPYATVTYGFHKKRTETIERGGQQPTWDAEFRFEILKEEYENEHLEAGGAAHVDKRGGVLPMSTKDATTGTNRLEKAKPTVTVGDGRRILKLACWADDNRDPRLIGEAELNIEDTIRKGNFDDWVKLERKDRYAGEIYLELTWYSNEPKPTSLHRPERSESPSRGSYGGAGSRLNDNDEGNESEEREGNEVDARETRTMHRQSQASLEVSNPPLNLAPDYPDSDLAPLSANHYPDSDLDPLTRSMSSLSFGRPLPQPPSLGPPSHHAPPVSHSQTYSHFPPTTGGYEYDRERRTSFHSVGPNGPYPYPPQQPQPPQQPPISHQQYQQSNYGPYPPPPQTEFGSYGDQQQEHYAQPPPHEQQLGEFEQLAQQHYANQGYEQSSVSSQRPLPQPGAPPTHQYYDQSYSQVPAHPSTSPYPPPMPEPPVPPIPPSTSVYWQKQQLQLQQQQQQQQRQQQQQQHHCQASSLPPSSTYPNLPSAMSYQQLPHSVSHATIHPSPSTPSSAPPPQHSYSAPPVPPSNLSHSYSTPPHAPAFQPPPVFSPPPPPPSLQGVYATPPSGPYPPVPPGVYHQQPVYDPNYDPSLHGRPPFPPMQQQQQQQQYRPY